MKKKVTPEAIQQAYELARSGFNHKQIYEALGICKQAFYNNIDLMDTVTKSQAELKKQIADALMAKAMDLSDTSALIFLSKRLNVFASNVEVSIKDGRTASEAMAKVTQLMASGELNTENGNALIKAIESYTKVYEVSELENRIREIETKLNGATK